MAFEFRKSTLTDIPTLLHMAEEAKKTMRQSGNLTQWSDGYPSDEVFRNDIGKGVSYVIEENGVAVGTFAFVPVSSFVRDSGAKMTTASIPMPPSTCPRSVIFT